MKKLFFALIVLIMVACTPKVHQLDEGLRFCEAVYTYEDKLLISNFGSDELNPLSTTEFKGYIMQYDGKTLTPFINANGMLSAPKGMVVVGNYLYVADVQRVVVFDLSSEDKRAFVLPQASKDLFVNHLVVVGDMILASVTNSDHILALQVGKNGEPGIAGFQIYSYVPGANGLLYDGDNLYVASYNPNGTPDEENVIYVIDNLGNPEPRPFISRMGMYDGLALNNGWLYFTDWIDATLGRVKISDPENIEIIPLELEQPMVGPAEIDFYDGALCIPDLPNSRVLMINNL